MAQVVNVNFCMDAQLRDDAEEIRLQMGMDLTTALTVFCKKLVLDRGIPFTVSSEPDPLEPDPFYPEELSAT